MKGHALTGQGVEHVTAELSDFIREGQNIGEMLTLIAARSADLLATCRRAAGVMDKSRIALAISRPYVATYPGGGKGGHVARDEALQAIDAAIQALGQTTSLAGGDAVWPTRP